MENSKLPFITDNFLQLNAVLRNSSQEFSDKGMAGRGGGVSLGACDLPFGSLVVSLSFWQTTSNIQVVKTNEYHLFNTEWPHLEKSWLCPCEGKVFGLFHNTLH